MVLFVKRKKIRPFETGHFNAAFSLASLSVCLLKSRAKNGEQTRLMLFLWKRKLVSNFGTVREGYGLPLLCHGFDYTHYVLRCMNYWFFYHEMFMVSSLTERNNYLNFDLL